MKVQMLEPDEMPHVIRVDTEVPLDIENLVEQMESKSYLNDSR